jgi:hypothetical protein
MPQSKDLYRANYSMIAVLSDNDMHLLRTDEVRRENILSV